MPPQQQPFPNLNIPNLPGGSGSQFTGAFGQAINTPAPDMFSHPMFQQLQGLLSPGNGSLSPTLQSLFGAASGPIQQRTDANVASAKTDALGRGMEGSSIENNAIQGAQAGGQSAMAQLLASILGLQVGQTSQYGQDIFGALGQQGQDFQGRLQQLLQFLSEGQASSANIDMFNSELQQTKGLADQQNQYSLINDLISGGSKIAAGYAGSSYTNNSTNYYSGKS